MKYLLFSYGLDDFLNTIFAGNPERLKLFFKLFARNLYMNYL